MSIYFSPRSIKLNCENQNKATATLGVNDLPDAKRKLADLISKIDRYVLNFLDMIIYLG